MLWELFITFFKIGLVSFGGGYVMIPVIEHEVTQHGWMSTAQFSEVIAVAGMAPGPLATNSAIFVGYETAGITGAIMALLGIVLPSLCIVLILATAIARFHRHGLFQSAFYGLRPIITALIIYAGVRFASTNLHVDQISWHTASLCLIFLVALFALWRLRLHPAFVILLSGMLGVVFYG